MKAMTLRVVSTVVSVDRADSFTLKLRGHAILEYVGDVAHVALASGPVVVPIVNFLAMI